MSKKIVITGIGIVSNLGIGKENVWNAIKQEEHGIKVINEWTDYDIGSQYFGKCQDFNIRDYLKLKPPFPNYYTQLGLLATDLAIKDSNLDLSACNPYDIGCIMNTNYGSNESVEKYLIKLLENGPSRVSPLTFTQTTNNHILGDIARYNNIKGPNTIVMGENSFSLGIQCIKNNNAKIMICGGLDNIRNFHLYILNENDKLLKTINNDADSLYTFKRQEQSKGKYVLGENACFVILEEKEHAIARNAHIYAEIVTTTTYTDLNATETFLNRTQNVLEDLIKTSIQKSNIKKSNIDMITGSSVLPWQMNEYELPVIEKFEIECIYTSILSRVGESSAASSLLNLAFSALAIDSNYVFGCNYNRDFFNSINDNIHIPKNGMHGVELNYVAVNSINTGGCTSCTILKNKSC